MKKASYGISQLRLAEISTLSQRSLTLCKSERYNDSLGTYPLVLDLDKEFQAFQQSYLKQTHSGLGKQLAELDKKRDLAFSALKVQIESLSKLGEDDYKGAEILYPIIKKYGENLDKLTYAAESNQLNGLIKELAKIDNLSKLRVIGLEKLFNLLKARQLEFEELFAEQAKINSELHHQPSASSLKKGLIEKLTRLFDVSEAMREQTGWKGLYSELMEYVKAAQGSLRDKPADIVTHPSPTTEDKVGITE